MEIKDGSARGLDADGMGGGILVTRNGSLTLTDFQVKNCFASGNGGGIYVDFGSELEAGNGVHTAEISGNQANGDGGGLFLYGTSTLNKVKVTNNLAQGSGGGIATGGQAAWLTGGYTIKNNSEVTNNTAQQNGGGIYVGTGSDLGVTKTKIQANRSVVVGGGVYAKGRAAFTECNIDGNFSQNLDGLGVYVGTGGNVTLTKTTTNNNRYQPPGPPGGGGGMEGLSEIEPEPVPDPNPDLASAVYVADDADELTMSECTVSGNDGHGVVGEVTSLGYNVVENSLTTSWGWIETDTVT
jgi:predicted outer membrane repeat protein